MNSWFFFKFSSIVFENDNKFPILSADQHTSLPLLSTANQTSHVAHSDKRYRLLTSTCNYWITLANDSILHTNAISTNPHISPYVAMDYPCQGDPSLAIGGRWFVTVASLICASQGQSNSNPVVTSSVITGRHRAPFCDT
jgi:hypothetical protein